MQINIGSEPGHKMPIFLGCYFLGVFSSVVVTLIWDFGGGGNFGVFGDGGADFWDFGKSIFLGLWGEGGVGVGVDWNLAQSLSLLVATLSASLFPPRLSQLVPS